MNFTNELSPADIEIILHRLGVEQIGKADSQGWTTIKSPLRDEKNASFGLNLQTGAWKDHATGDAGDIVTLTQHINSVDAKEAITWIKDQTDITGALYNPPSNGKVNKHFWTKERLQWIKKGIKRIDQEPNHHLLKTAKEYDCLDADKLKQYGCGIVEQWGKEWLALPYSTGCQLYRRDDGKNIRSVKGSAPGDAFFGTKQHDRNGTLLIAKSPRETMLLKGLYGYSFDVIGLCTGEQGDISKKLRSELRKQISASNFEYIYTLLDCDTDSAYQTAKAFTELVHDVATESKFSGQVKLVNIHKATGSYKDVADCIRAGMDQESFQMLFKSSESIKVSEVSPSDDDIFDVSTAPQVPDIVYQNLPKLLQTRCSLIEQKHRKDVFLISALPVIASHLTKVVAGHADGYYSPDLFTLIVADPGAGKGVATKAKKLGDTLNKHLIDQSKQERDNFESLPKDEKINLSEPKDRSLLIPANSSSRAIYDTMEANDGWGLLFETEIDTMLNATGQEWGNFSDITRKAFHHEDISINRKNEQFFIDSPRLSICITGTFDQFKKMFQSAENGHFSRYALYTFDVPRKWQSHRPTKKSRQLDESIVSASDALFNLYKILRRRADHLYIDLTNDQWQTIDDTFADNMQAIEDLDLSTYLHASNNRAAILALRMASMFAVLRTFEENPGHLEYADSITPTNADMVASLYLADSFIKHAIRLYNILPNATDTDGKGERYNKYLQKLPDKFSTGQALEIGEELSIPEPTIKRWLSSSNDINRIKHGYYTKISN